MPLGDEFLKLVYKPDKLQTQAEGPYIIETVHTNGTVIIQLNPTMIKRIKIQRIKAYKQS